MPTYHSWLVVDQPPETDEARSREPLLQLLDSFRRFPRFVAGSARPAVGLRIEKGAATLVARTRKDQGAFFDMVREKRQLVAFALHPAAALRALHGTVFRTAGATVELLGAQGIEGARDPYFRRMVRFQLGVTSLDPTTRSEAEVLVGEFEEHERLLLDPRPLDFDEQQAQDLCATLAIERLLAEATCMVLPPVVNTDSLDPRSYFHQGWQTLRSTFATANSIAKPREHEPLMTRVWRLQHDESMRDVLREGASLTVTVHAGSPARVDCNLPRKPLDAIANWRRRQLLAPDSTPGPSWARRLAAAVASDVADAAAGAVDDANLAVSLVDSELDAMPEQIPPLPPFEPSESAKEGLWQRLDACHKLIPEGDASRVTFHEVVLWPSNNDPRWAPDHSLALKAFMAYVWRCPWPETVASTDAWKEATAELIEETFKGSRSAAEVTQKTDGWPRATRQENTLVLTLLPTLMTGALQWALQLPVGSIVNDGGWLVLDDPRVTLDDAFVLA